MTTMTTSCDDTPSSAAARRPMLRRMLMGGAGFDLAMGFATLVAAADFARWLAIDASGVRVTGAIFLAAAAAAAGAFALRRPVPDVRPVVAANAVFGLWCIALIVADSPNALGTALLVGAAITSGATAAAEHRLGRG
jgi:hypothetical protein